MTIVGIGRKLARPVTLGEEGIIGDEVTADRRVWRWWRERGRERREVVGLVDSAEVSSPIWSGRRGRGRRGMGELERIVAGRGECLSKNDEENGRRRGMEFDEARERAGAGLLVGFGA